MFINHSAKCCNQIDGAWVKMAVAMSSGGFPSRQIGRLIKETFTPDLQRTNELFISNFLVSKTNKKRGREMVI